MKGSGRAVIILIGALVILIVLSACPWETWTGGRLKNFHIFSDLMSEDLRMEMESEQNKGIENIDPALAELIASSSDSISTDSVSAQVDSDTLTVQTVIPRTEALRDGDIVLIEDYSADSGALTRLKKTFDEALGRRVRIAMLGDSYIEGDIFAQDIRAGLQKQYGGRGVGYVPAFTNIPGYRGSVIQSGSKWVQHEISKMSNDPLRTIVGQYHEGEQGATSRFKGSAKPEKTDYWTSNTMIFSAPNAGSITFRISGEDSARVFQVNPSADLQAIEFAASAKDLSITSNVPEIKVLGYWLESPTGIVLDDISLRGNSGISHRQLNVSTTAQMRRWIDYDLIILVFGMNAISPGQTNYNAYTKGMEGVIANLRSLYPNSEILIMGVGDRGARINGNLVSMPAVVALVDAQRALAQRTGTLFYDTRAAMGGEGAAVDWNKRHLVNSDYVHLNHKGGSELAKIFLESLNHSLK